MKRQCKYPTIHKNKYERKAVCLICRHAEPHEQTPDCFIKCCDVHSKDVRCIIVGESS